MTIGGSGTDLVLTGTGNRVHGGTLTHADIALSATGGGHHRLEHLQVTGNNLGISLTQSEDNEVSHSRIDGNAVIGVFLWSSHHNRLHDLEVDDTSGIGPAEGIRLLDSNENVVTRNTLEHNLCTGIELDGSSRNSVCFNTVQDSYSTFPNAPAENLLLLNASTENLICGNQTSATAPGTDDGINLGCKGNCNCFHGPTTGASDNLVIGNTADHEDRYGMAQATGNDGNVYLGDEASGNGVANFAIDP
jgi:parallel beta-helix repeat protein